MARPRVITHRRLLKLTLRLPSDYEPWGQVSNSERGADCSCGCAFALWLGAVWTEGMWTDQEVHRLVEMGDWLLCTRPDGPRAGMLTFEHQNGSRCFVGGPEPRWRASTEAEMRRFSERADRRIARLEAKRAKREGRI